MNFQEIAPITDTAETDLKTKALRLLAQDIRALRKARGLTLSGLAEQLGRSVGWLSQVERGITLPSLADIRALANQFKVPVSLFFTQGAADEASVIVRAGQRRQLGTSDSGVLEELLSPELGGSFEFVRSVIEPGAGLAEPERRAAEEAGYVVSGVLEIEIGGEWHRLTEGDSFRFRRESYRWRNPGPGPAVLVRVVAPPVY